MDMTVTRRELRERLNDTLVGIITTDRRAHEQVPDTIEGIEGCSGWIRRYSDGSEACDAGCYIKNAKGELVGCCVD